MSASVIICLVQILNSANGSGNGRFYFSDNVWDMLDKIVFVVFLVEMWLQWAVYGVIAPKGSAYFYQPVNWLEFLVNSMMIIGALVTSEPLQLILQKFRIVRIAKLPGIITSFSSDKSLSTFLTCISDAFVSLTSVVAVTMAFIFFFGIIGVQIFKGRYDSCLDPTYPQGMNFQGMHTDAYPYGCAGPGYTQVSGNNIYLFILDHFFYITLGKTAV